MPHVTDRDHDAPQGAALRAAKLGLRRRMVADRDRLSIDFRVAAARTICEHLAALPEFARAGTLLLTLSFRSEWDTLPLVKRALTLGKTVAVPRVNAAARMLELHSITDPAADIVPGFHDIPEPVARCARVPASAIEWVLVPGVAFDPTGRRLGYGGGYYDRLLPQFAAGTPRVAGAYDLQIIDRVPAAPHDLTVDTIVTEVRTLRADPRR